VKTRAGPALQVQSAEYLEDFKDLGWQQVRS
jgi:hypothetical protein